MGRVSQNDLLKHIPNSWKGLLMSMFSISSVKKLKLATGLELILLSMVLARQWPRSQRPQPVEP